LIAVGVRVIRARAKTVDAILMKNIPSTPTINIPLQFVESVGLKKSNSIVIVIFRPSRLIREALVMVCDFLVVDMPNQESLLRVLRTQYVRSGTRI
jgi:hypothetical protein